MSVSIIPFDPKIKKLIVEVMLNARTQQYTPERLCELQKVVEAQYYYWWCMDMKKEEFCTELFADDFTYYCFGPQTITGDGQALRSKFVNENLATSHMGHQPLVWFRSDTEARAIFEYEDFHVYTDDMTPVSSNVVYVDDFRKESDGAWRITAMRMAFKKINGVYRSTDIPQGWEPKSWKPVLKKGE
jgi:hypothetical protein